MFGRRKQPSGKTAAKDKPGNSLAVRGPAGVDEAFIAADVSGSPAGGGKWLARDNATGMLHVLDEVEAGILRKADRFRTVGELGALLSAEGWEQDESLSDTVASLAARGLLRSLSKTQDRIEKLTRSSEKPRVTSIGWITANRPGLLERSMESFRKLFDLYGRSIRFIVCDESSDPGDCAENREALRRIGGDRALYLGREEKRDFIARLVQASGDGVSQAVLEYALGNPEQHPETFGTNRNHFLLATAGELAIGADDDTVGLFSAHPEAEDGLVFRDGMDTIDCIFYPDRKSLLANIRFAEQDILSLHESVLCGEAFRKTDLSDASPGAVSILERGEIRIPIVSAGLAGDSAVGSPRFVLQLEGKGRERLHASETAYCSALVSREMFRAPEKITCTRNAHLMPG